MTVATGNEKQVVTLTGSPAGGTFTLTFSGQTTGGIAPSATAAGVKAALVALSNIDTADVNVTGTGPWTVEFTGAYADTDVPAMTASGAGLTGGTSPAAGVSTSVPGNPVATERAYAAINDGTGAVRNVEVLVGQRPPAGAVLVDASDYYGGGGP